MRDSLLPTTGCFVPAGVSVPVPLKPRESGLAPQRAVDAPRDVARGPRDSVAELLGTLAAREHRRLAIVREAVRGGHPLNRLEERFDWFDNVGEGPSC
jgi:hypothetical protein